MRTLRLGTNVTVFLLFFGIALLDAIRVQDWTRGAAWVALGFLCLWADIPKRIRGDRSTSG